MGRTPKVLLYDIEITPLLGYAYQVWDANIIKVKEHAYMMCFSYQWLGESRIHNVSLPDFKQSYAKDPKDDKMLTSSLWKLIDEADIVVAHNANGFDNKVANTRFLVHGMTPPSPYKSVDTLQVARRIAKFPSNSLDNLAKQLGVGSKTAVKHGDLWEDCINGDMKAWKKMVKYNNMDVEVLRNLYLRLLPYMNTHPNLSVISQVPMACPKCGSTNVERRGYRYTNTGAFRKYWCRACGGWHSERIGDKDIIKATYVNYS